jgi:hypothetical protein
MTYYLLTTVVANAGTRLVHKWTTESPLSDMAWLCSDFWDISKRDQLLQPSIFDKEAL